jgi:hypothetical protein
VAEGPIDVRVPEPPDPARDVLGVVRRRLDGERRLPLRDVAFEAHIERDVLARLFTAAGRLRDDDRYGDRDLSYARDLVELSSRFDLDVLERMLRLHQRAATTVAVNQLALLQHDVRLAPLLVPGADVPPPLVEVIADDAERLLPLTHRLLAPQDAGGYIPGTHAYLDRLEAHLKGAELPGWMQRYGEVEAGYAELTQELAGRR